AGVTSRSTPFPYVLTAFWAGMEGSLLFWSLLTGIYASIAVATQWPRRAELVPAATAVLSGILVFFCSMVAFGANPFGATSPIPLDGQGLNPLLQSPFMNIHPVLLYLGFTGFSVPFAFALSSLASGRPDLRWFTSTRRFTVGAWSFLSIGIILGGAWAYHELGWGGYWAWDPVENASLLPWLTSTAFLHSVMIQERRGMLKVWNVALILATYGLVIFGTFLTRSGLLSSVHTFSESPLGAYFLPFLGVLGVGAFGLLGARLDRLRSERHLDSVLSREAMFLFNNLVLVAITFTVLWGTLYPILVEAFQGVKVSVGPAYFNAVVGPLGLALVALAGIGPLVAWRRACPESLLRHLAPPLALGATTMALMAAAGLRSAGGLFAFGLCVFVAATIVTEFFRGARAHRSIERLGWTRALIRTVKRNRRRYGGYIVHLGVALIVVGIAGGVFRQYWSGTVAPGESFRIGAYTIRYAEPLVVRTDEKMVLMAVMEVSRGTRRLGLLRPQRNFHFAQRQSQSEIGLRVGLAEDLYLVLTQMDSTRAATVRAWVNPLMSWLWIGGLVMTLGMAIIWTERFPTEPRPSRPASVKDRVGAPA
ncbi:MAG: heme lyase CcmF/NrfE family subunit, partial [Actinomycetota bacterium]